jgi:multidrug efflux system outer membrane protein
LKETPGIKYYTTVLGFSRFCQSQKTCSAFFFVTLKMCDERKTPRSNPRRHGHLTKEHHTGKSDVLVHRLSLVATVCSRLAMSMILVFLVLSPLFILGGCAVGPDYKRPGLEVPEAFRGASAEISTNALAGLKWWEVFEDDSMQELIRTALTNNYDLRIAIARVEQTRAIAEQNRALFFPQLDYQGAVAREKNASRNEPVANGGRTVNVFSAAGTVSWEIDLWGRIRRLNENARAQFLASEEGRRDVTLSVLSQVAQAYLQLLALDQELEIARSATNSFGESLKIFSERLAGGIVSKLETSRAEASLGSAAATVPDLERQIIFQENQINVLVGRNPGPVPRQHTLLEQRLPPAIPAGLPSALIERRPDIRQHEQLLRAANAQVGVAVADFFPQLNLTGLFGQVSPELSAFTAGGANAWSIAANLAGPLFHGGQLAAQYRQALANRAEAELHYKAAVLAAFQEVSNELIAIQKFGEARQQQARAVEAYKVAVEVSTQRYVAGRAGYFEMLEAQQELFPAENILVQTQLNQLLAIVQLYKALGGDPGDAWRGPK